MSPSRREVLQALTAVVPVGLAGCSSLPPSGPTTSTASDIASKSPTDEPPISGTPAAPVPSCPEGYHSFEPWWKVKGPGPLGGFELSLNKQSYTQGEELTARLRNITDESRTTGVKKMFDIQFEGNQGWHTIFGLPEGQDAAYPLVGLRHPSGEGFTWNLTLSQEGLSEGSIESAKQFHACLPIEPGNYRFVYWGVGESKAAIGVQFTVASG